MTSFFLGTLVGMLVWRGITSYRGMYRVCCREHYATHKTCECRDCVWERQDTLG